MDGEGGPQPLGELVDLVRGTTYSGMRLGEPGPVLLGLASIERDGGFRTDSLRTYGGDSPEHLLLRPGDIFVSLKDVTQSADLLGAVARVPASVPLGRLTQDTVKLKLKPGASGKLIYWTLRTPQYRAFCRAHATGTTNLGLPRGDFLAFHVPPLDASREVLLDLLEALDYKIELNRRIAATLETTARALFKNWFVDFDPVRAKIEGRSTGLPDALAALFPDRLSDDGLPEGWRTTNNHLATVKRDSVDPTAVDPETPYLGLEHIEGRNLVLKRHGQASDVNSLKTRFARGDLLFGKLRPYFHKVVIAPFAGICSSDIIVFEPCEGVPLSYLALTFSETSFIDMASNAAGGTRMPRADWGYMRRQEAVRPSDEVLAAFDGASGPALERAQAAQAESRTLADLRDALLPKLVSGELRIRDAGRMVAAA